jgi:uncharacterized protein YvpB
MYVKKMTRLSPFLFVGTSAALLLWTTGCSVNPPSAAKRPSAPLEIRQDPPAMEQAVQEQQPIRSMSAKQVKQAARPARRMLDVPLIKQNPELKYGCEVTSLAMLLRYAGHDVDKLTLARQVRKDKEPLVQHNGNIKQWGDPNKGFVGDMTGKRKGFAVYNKPLEELMRRYMGERTRNLTGKPFDALLDSVAAGKPVVIWATGDFTLPTEWESWHKDGKKIVAPFDEHVVLLVGYDSSYVYVNDPLSGVKQQRVSRQAMKKSWEALGKQALSYR